ncbi:MAG: PIN domain-containing protein [Polyangiales bacterium]
MYDTCVLVPAPLRDFVLRAAEAGLVRASMSDEILDELQRVLVRDLDVPDAAAKRLRGAVERSFPDSIVKRSRYADLLGTNRLPDKDDEHVMAAARTVGAQVIVTSNLKDFPTALANVYDIEVLHPDDFALDLIDLFPLKVARIIEEQASTLRNSPRTYEEVLEFLSRSIPESVARLREL